MKNFLKVLAVLTAAAALQAVAANAEYPLIASAAQTSAQINSADQVNLFYKGGHIVISVSAYTSGNYTATVQGKDTVTGNYYNILVGPAISTTGQTVLKVYPGTAAIANGAATDILPQTWRVQLNGLASPSMTLAVTAVMEN